MHSVLISIHRFSARALSNESPTDPMDAWIPAVTRRVVSLIAVYWADSTGRRNTGFLDRL
jgi:hypothetical protein